MEKSTFVPILEGQLDPEAERRTPIFILALTHEGRVVRLEPGFAKRADHLARARLVARAHYARYLRHGPRETLPIVGYRYFVAPDRGYRLSPDGEVTGTFRGRPIEAGLVTEGGEGTGFGLED